MEVEVLSFVVVLVLLGEGVIIINGWVRKRIL